ncbi:MAG: hypothetical protein IKK66_03095 [Ruminococcus sp.]|nr:hypothetical protein [Ruminococcus sp.]
MLDFIKVHKFSIFCLLALIWIFTVIRTQLKYKKKGERLQGKIVNYVQNSGNFFPVFQFEYNGQHLTVDSYNASKNANELGQTDTIYYIPGNQKGVFRERDLTPKLWMIVMTVVAIAYIILDFIVFNR